ncbi:MAG: glycoside hydrolase family 32 protein, partial [Muribaculaceae bacterium]|nr:glycoside hydrolase family 32 protein [Muribaculaceae bacterium]
TQYRPYYHQSPEYGWMNDPNGMVYVDGVWHLFYQWNPYGSKWQNMTWGHATSTDLINWNHHGAAIVPDGLGSIFSGSCVLDRNNTAGFGKDAVIALYTSAAASQIQSLAYSNDNGMTFTPYAGNPILTLESEARDPNMFWNDKTNEWNLILAHALDYEMLLFTSPNLKDWTLQSAFGKGLGCQDGVWECPDLFELSVDGTDKKKWVVLCNINPGGPFGGSATQYFVGDFDGKKFVADTDASGKVPTKWMDFGKDHYATVSWSDAPDHRRTVIGWMSNWQYAADVPTTQFRSANTLPREMELFTAPDGQIMLASVPSPELNALRGKVVSAASKKSIGGKATSFNLPVAKNAACEIVADLDAKNASEITLTLSNKLGDKVDMIYDVKAHTISVDRRHSGIVNFSENFPAVTVAPTFETNGKLNLRIFLDSSSVELFANNGKSVQTNLVFPNEPYTTFSVSSNGGARLENLKIYAAK